MQKIRTLAEEIKFSTGQNVNTDYLISKFYDTSLDEDEHLIIATKLKYLISSNYTVSRVLSDGTQSCNFGGLSNLLIKNIDLYGTTTKNALLLKDRTNKTYETGLSFCSPYFDVKITLNKEQPNYETLESKTDSKKLIAYIPYKDKATTNIKGTIICDYWGSKTSITDNCLIIPKATPVVISATSDLFGATLDVQYLTSSATNELLYINKILEDNKDILNINILYYAFQSEESSTIKKNTSSNIIYTFSPNPSSPATMGIYPYTGKTVAANKCYAIIK